MKALEGRKTTKILDDFPAYASVAMAASPSHLAVSADSFTLAVCVRKNGFIFAEMYDIRAFATKVLKYKCM